MRNILAIASLVIKEMYRRRDFYVLYFLTVVICAILASVNIFNDPKTTRYLKEACLLLIWISSLFIAIGIAARQLPMEIESRTIFPLLAKPVSRREVLLGKFLGCWLACGIALLCFYVFFELLSESREREWRLLSYFQAASLHWLMLGVLIAFVLFGSLVFTAPSSNAVISFVLTAGILAVGRHLNKVAIRIGGLGKDVLYSIYYAIPHLEMFDERNLIIHNWPVVEWKFYAIAAAYAAFYMAIFLSLAAMLFQRKAITG